MIIKDNNFMKIYNESKKKSILYSEYKSESYKLNNKKGDLNKNKFNEYNNIYSAHKRENKFTNNNSFLSNKIETNDKYNNSLNNTKNIISKNTSLKNNIPGVRMYNQYKEYIKKKEVKIRKIKDEEEKLEKKELKFKPSINNYSKTEHYPGKIEDKLIAYGKKYKQNIINKKKENYIENIHRPKLTKETEILGKIKRKNREDNLPNHTIFINPDYLVEPSKTDENIINNNGNILSFSFNKNNINLKNMGRSKSFDNNQKRYYKTYYKPLHPVTRKTTKILGRKIPLPQLTPDKNLYDYLYIEAKLLKEKRDIDIMKDMIKRFPFKPDLSKSNDKKQKFKKKKNVFDRLFVTQHLIKKLNKTPEAKNNKRKNILKDSKTGQPLFKPKITREPLNPYQRDLSYEKNLNYKNEINNKKIQEEENKNKQENKRKYLEKMNKIILEARNLKYVELFHNLDSDNDGLISNKKIKISILNNEKLYALTPIFKELQYEGTQMDLKMFCEKAENIEELKKIIEFESNI